MLTGKFQLRRRCHAIVVVAKVTLPVVHQRIELFRKEGFVLGDGTGLRRTNDNAGQEQRGESSCAQTHCCYGFHNESNYRDSGFEDLS